MTSVSTDRRQGVNSSAAFKVPVRAATTANITLSGEQTIDGVACVTGNRVLVKNQTTASQNGIYDVDTGSWTRAVDCDGTYDLKNGTLVEVNSGTVSARLVYVCTTSDPITIGTSSIAFSVMSPSSPLSLPLSIAQGGTSGDSAVKGLAGLGVVACTAVGGTANAITCTVDSTVTAYRTNQIFELTPASTNTAATTLTPTPSGAGALAGKNIFSNGAALVGGELLANVPVFVQYDGTQLNIIGPFTGILQKRLILTPTATYDLSANTLAAFLLLNQTGTISVTASKELDAIRWEQTFTVNSGASASLAHCELTASASSHSTSNLYGVVGAIHNAGPGTTKALYGRAIADAGCTGVVMGGVMAAETRAGVIVATCLQMTGDSADATAITHFIWGSKNSAGTLNATYGILFDSQVAFVTSAFEVFAAGAGDFLTLKNAAGSVDLFRVLSTGSVISAVDLTAGSAANGVTVSSAAVTRTAATGVLSIVAGANGKLILDANSGDIQWNKPLVALGGGAAPTLGTIGGTGPGTAGQNTWLRFLDSAGAAAWLPVWK